MAKMTQAAAQAEARKRGFTLRRSAGGDYRLNRKGASENTAYYTDDLEDAIDTMNTDIALAAAAPAGAIVHRTDKIPPRTVIQALSALVGARRRCYESGNLDAAYGHEVDIRDIETNHLPHGSGFDWGTSVDLEQSTEESVVLHMPYERIDENGYYCERCDYSVIVKPAFVGITIEVFGAPGEDTCNADTDYIGQVLQDVLESSINK